MTPAQHQALDDAHEILRVYDRRPPFSETGKAAMRLAQFVVDQDAIAAFRDGRCVTTEQLIEKIRQRSSNGDGKP